MRQQILHRIIAIIHFVFLAQAQRAAQNRPYSRPLPGAWRPKPYNQRPQFVAQRLQPPIELEPWAVTQEIKKADSIEGLLRTYIAHRTRLNPIHLSACWMSFGRLASAPWNAGQALEPLQSRLVQQTVQTIESGELAARQLANMAYGAARTGNGKSLDALFDPLGIAAEERVSDFNAQELSNLIWAYATADRSDELLFDAVARMVEQRVSEFKPQELSNIAWAFATAGRPDLPLFAALAQGVQRCVGDFKPQELSNTEWAFATVGHLDEPLFAALAAETERRLRDFKAQELANTAWAFATLGQSNPSLFAALATAVKTRLADFNAQNLANTAWAFATVNRSDEKLFDALSGAVEEHIGEFTDQGLASTAWAFATVGRSDARLFATIARTAKQHTDKFDAQGLANMAWAFATTDRFNLTASVHPEFLPNLAKAVSDQVENFNAQGLANVGWAFAKAGWWDAVLTPVLSSELARAAERRHVDEFTTQGLVIMAWALATMGQSNDLPFFKTVARKIEQGGDDFNAQEISSTAWAFAQIGWSETPLFAALASMAERRMGEFTEQGLSNIAWAFAVANFYSPQLFGPAFIHRCEAAIWTPTQLRQLHQWILWHDELKLPPPLPPSLRERCLDSFQKQAEIIADSSRLQRKVARTLIEQLGAEAQEEVIIEEGYTIDVVINWEGKRIAMEIDGPSHFLGGEAGRTPNGPTLFKRRLLRSLGWIMVVVPHWEWAELNGNKRRLQYLSCVLESLRSSSQKNVLQVTAAEAYAFGDKMFKAKAAGPSDSLPKVPPGPSVELLSHTSPKVSKIQTVALMGVFLGSGIAFAVLYFASGMVTIGYKPLLASYI